MSSQVSGRLRVEQENQRLLALARTVLDPQAFVRWIQAGRAGALEAARMLAATSGERTEALRASLEHRRRTQLPIDGVMTADLSCALEGRFDAAAANLAGALEEGRSAGATVDLGAAADVLESETRVFAAAVTASLQAEGFIVDEPEWAPESVTLLGHRGAQLVSVGLVAGTAVVDVGVPGFASTSECEGTRDAIVGRFQQYGILVERPEGSEPRTPHGRQIAAAVERAVGEALPSFEIRSFLADDELQVIALPNTQPGEGESA